jgi:hypothetical protein
MFSGFQILAPASSLPVKETLYSLSETNADAFLPEINKLVYNPSRSFCFFE